MEERANWLRESVIPLEYSSLAGMAVGVCATGLSVLEKLPDNPKGAAIYAGVAAVSYVFSIRMNQEAKSHAIQATTIESALYARHGEEQPDLDEPPKPE